MSEKIEDMEIFNDKTLVLFDRYSEIYTLDLDTFNLKNMNIKVLDIS